jgi:adenosine kinase
VTGSVATDHLMVFPGRFADQLLPDQLATISLSFLVDRLEVRRGGVGANIAFGLGQFALSPLLIAAVGADFADYALWLKKHGVDTDGVRVFAEHQTARFMCITDQDANQIASFCTGAMAEAGTISLPELLPPAGRPGLVVISPNAPAAMLRHTAECRTLALPFAADPSQQLARLDQDQARALVDGATWLFTNEYEAALLTERTHWSHAEILSAVGAWVTTLGARGVRIETAGLPPLLVPAVPGVETLDPTGAGDAFRAGFLAAVSHRIPQEPAARLGCAMAATALGAIGSQSYRADPAHLTALIESAYGTGAARPLAALLGRLS